jgi:hypothetical protein
LIERRFSHLLTRELHYMKALVKTQEYTCS